jgi:murein DD-endopeptidase MepM/ murein hydrolase activator NlpD
MLVGVAAVPVAMADDLKDKKARVQRKLHGAHNDLEHSSAALRRATAALQTAQTQLNKAQGRLSHARGELAAAEALDRQMQAKLDAAIARLNRARAQLERGHGDVAEQERELGAMVAQNYQSGGPALMGLSVVLNSQDPGKLTGQLNSMQSVLDKEAAALARLEASKVLLTVKEQEVEEAKEEVAERRRAAARNLERKQKLEAKAEAAKLEVENLVEMRAQAESEAEEAKEADLRTLRSLEQEKDRIATILKRRAERARRRAAAAAAAAASANAGPTSGNGFLDFPVRGYVTSPFGWRRHPIYGYRSLHDGIDFGAGGCGAPLYAAANGRVLDRYYQSAYGNRLIIDHGWRRSAGVATIYNHASRYVVSPGQRVRRGQIVGYMGTTGWSTGCHLHFTVLQNGSAVNPWRWL